MMKWNSGGRLHANRNVPVVMLPLQDDTFDILTLLNSVKIMEPTNTNGYTPHPPLPRVYI
jgi:hypothetical protein